jgi:hypothetical protein
MDWKSRFSVLNLGLAVTIGFEKSVKRGCLGNGQVAVLLHGPSTSKLGRESRPNTFAYASGIGLLRIYRNSHRADEERDGPKQANKHWRLRDVDARDDHKMEHKIKSSIKRGRPLQASLTGSAFLGLQFCGEQPPLINISR